MLTWGLSHSDQICQKTGQIITEALRLKGDHLVQLPFSKALSARGGCAGLCPGRLQTFPRMETLLEARAMLRRPSQCAVATKSSTQVGPKPQATGGWDSSCADALWPMVSDCHASWVTLSLPALTWRVSTSACATSVACHPSMGHLAAWVTQQGDSSSMAT